MKDSTMISMTAILGICTLEATALIMGIDGATFGAVTALVGVIAGYEWQKDISKKNDEAKSS